MPKSCALPSRDGRSTDVVLGFDTLEEYVADSPFFGATVGRCAGRIGGVPGSGAVVAASGFVLDGSLHQLGGCDGGGGGILPGTNVHGGPRGLDKAVWTVVEVGREGGAAWATFRIDSPCGDQGFPGKLGVELSYRLAAGMARGGDHDLQPVELHLDYRARSSKATPVSLTNHSYWNLAGHDAVTADGAGAGLKGQTLRLAPLRGWLQDDGSGSGVFTGTIGDCSGIHDWASADVELGRRLQEVATAQPLWPHGDAYVLAASAMRGFDADTRAATRHLHLAATVRDPASGRTMQVHSSEPVVQTYFSTLLDCKRGKEGKAYGAHSGLCLEMQRFANAVNVPSFPSNVLQPGEEYRQLTVHTFSVIDKDASASST